MRCWSGDMAESRLGCRRMIYKLGSICIPAPAPAGDRGACLPTCTDSHKRGRSAHLRTHRHTYMPPASKKHAPRSRARARRRRPADLHGFRRGAPAGGGQVSNNNRASKATQRSKGREAFEQPLLLQQSKAEEERGGQVPWEVCWTGGRR